MTVKVVRPADPDEAVRLALVLLRSLGVPPERVVIGVADPYVKGEDTSYQTHVGAGRDYDGAAVLAHVARDLRGEADDAAQALFGGKVCPRCGSPRVRYYRERADSATAIRVLFYDDCMDCDWRSEPR